MACSSPFLWFPGVISWQITYPKGPWHCWLLFWIPFAGLRHQDYTTNLPRCFTYGITGVYRPKQWNHCQTPATHRLKKPIHYSGVMWNSNKLNQNTGRETREPRICTFQSGTVGVKMCSQNYLWWDFYHCFVTQRVPLWEPLSKQMGILTIKMSTVLPVMFHLPVPPKGIMG